MRYDYLPLAPARAGLKPARFAPPADAGLDFDPRAYDFDPGDGHPLTLRVLRLDAADGAARPRVLLGWYRFVCANVLAVGTTQADLAPLDGDELSRALALAERDRVALKVWRTLRVPVERLVRFADDELTPAWGVEAAARFLHIATTGFDGEPARLFQTGPAHARPMHRTRRVPGSPPCAKSAYDAAQILAWIAKDRREAHERVDRVLQIPALMQRMIRRD